MLAQVPIEDLGTNSEYLNTIPMDGRARVRAVATEQQCDPNLLELYLLEHSICRRLVRANGHFSVMVDFDLLTEEQLQRACTRSSWATITSWIWFDGVRPEDAAAKLVQLMVGAPAESPNGRIVEGLIMPTAWPMTFNDIPLVDPLFEISPYVMVVDKGTAYQWQFARYVPKSLVSSGHSAFESDVVHLLPFEIAVADYRRLFNAPETTEGVLRAAIQQVVVQRRILLRQLEYWYHEKVASTGPGVANEGFAVHLPKLFRFDSLDTSSIGSVRIRTNLAPTYYAASMRHLAKALELDSLGPPLEDVVSETVPGILLAYLSLDTHVNYIGYQSRTAGWSDAVGGSLEARIGFLTRRGGVSGTLMRDRPDLRRSVEVLTRLRDSLVHFKYEPFDVTEVDGVPVSRLYTQVSAEGNRQVVQSVRRLIVAMHEARGEATPPWLSKHSMWLEDVDDALFI